MVYFVRRLNSDVWPEDEEQINIALGNFDEISADPFSKCLKTHNNTLSLWKVSSDGEVNKSTLAKSIIALVTAPNQKTLSPLDVIYFSDNDLKEDELLIEQTDGETSIPDLVNTHFDIIGINYKKLENVGRLVLKTLLNNSIESFTRKEVIDLLNSYLDEDIENNYKNINENILIFMGEITQRKLVNTDFYKDLNCKSFLDLKITVLNDLYSKDKLLLDEKIHQLPPREKSAFRIDVNQKANSKKEYNELIDFVMERTN
ncbi:hypothetical protein [Acinetobacter tibetensis]|uniref:Uncharacterized protein n=1 Tax=Acinetobacter tibetensis TaxID=2943497 RepID=A0AAE9S1J9_9GAMM|nr:hypothetical protein [Acinetobacter tibetensis]USE84364.1 hypothetical protein M5E07_06070 [Acinetobacter tibetensis]